MAHFIRFNVVGILGFAVQTGVLVVLTHYPYQSGYLLATAAAVEIAVLHNFIWHQRWTWRDRPSATIAETFGRLVKFNITNGAVSIGGNLLFMSLLVGRLRLPIAGANAMSVAACSICNFFLADRIAFWSTAASKARRRFGFRNQNGSKAPSMPAHSKSYVVSPSLAASSPPALVSGSRAGGGRRVADQAAD
jgi:putative flippase GtrA